jgi:predicted dehydrogenase
MGTQNHGHPGYVRLVEMLRNKVIGDIREVHVITDRPGRWWPQGLDLPAGQPPIPAHLHWDLWLGPAAERDYHDAYVPFRWRGWWDFGCGAIGDMAIHLMDPTFDGLELGGRRVRVRSRGPEPLPHSGPTHMTTQFTFPEDRGRNELSVYWYEGSAEPPPEVRGKLPMNGSLFVGTAGEISIAHDQQPTILGQVPREAEPEESPPFSATQHHQQWLTACKTGGATGSSFACAGPFTEVVLLGNVAYRVGREITYDPQTMSTGDPDADRLLRKEYRSGWEV